MTYPTDYVTQQHHEIAELQARIAELEDEAGESHEDIRLLTAQKEAAYHERNQLVSALSKLFPSHLCRHPEDDAEWERDWMWIVCIHIPVTRGWLINVGMEKRWETVQSQACWHIHDDELPLFRHLVTDKNHWDGHSVAEKYERLRTLKTKKRGWFAWLATRRYELPDLGGKWSPNKEGDYKS